MKKLLIILSFVLLSSEIKAQLTSYSTYDNEYSTVYSVDEMDPDEIRDYNDWINDSVNPRTALLWINSARSWYNLKAAPSTIIDYIYTGKITETDSLPSDCLGAQGLGVMIINTTPITIKKITLWFRFSNSVGNQVYNTKNGGQYCILTFNHITGRTSSNLYRDISNTLMNCIHSYSIGDASSKTLFYNEKAEKVRLEKVLIEYENGKKSSQAALFDTGYSNDKNMLDDGPLKPAMDIVEYFKNK